MLRTVRAWKWLHPGSLSELSYLLRISRDIGLRQLESWTALDQLQGRARFMTWKLYNAAGQQEG